MVVHNQSWTLSGLAWVFQSIEELYWNSCFVQMKVGFSSAGDESMNLSVHVSISTLCVGKLLDQPRTICFGKIRIFDGQIRIRASFLSDPVLAVDCQ